MQNTLVKESVVKHALLNQYNLILLAGMGLFSIATGSVIPLLVAAGAEVLWLLVGAQSARFHGWVEKQARQRIEHAWRTKVEAAAAGIDPNAAARLRLVGGALMEIASASADRGPPEFVTAMDARLDSSLQMYAQLAAAHQRLVRLMGAGGTEAAEGEIVRFSRALAEEKDATVRISLRQAVALAQRRLKRFEQVESVGRDLTVKMSTFEASLEYLRAQVRAGEPEEEILLAVDEMTGAARFNPEYEADVTRVLGDRRMTTGMYPVAPSSSSSDGR
ncbi:MAG: hypothetical protein ABJA82_05630 [Myxococcales bacterium]